MICKQFLISLFQQCINFSNFRSIRKNVTFDRVIETNNVFICSLINFIKITVIFTERSFTSFLFTHSSFGKAFFPNDFFHNFLIIIFVLLSKGFSFSGTDDYLHHFFWIDFHRFCNFLHFLVFWFFYYIAFVFVSMIFVVLLWSVSYFHFLLGN